MICCGLWVGWGMVCGAIPRDQLICLPPPPPPTLTEFPWRARNGALLLEPDPHPFSCIFFVTRISLHATLWAAWKREGGGGRES